VSTSDSVAVTAIYRILGPAGGGVAAVVICLVVTGSLLGNSFVAGRMTVAAARRSWLPPVLAVVGRVGSAGGTSRGEGSLPEPDDGNDDDKDDTASDAPINAIILSALLSALFVVFGSFRALLTFNGLGEYSFFYLTLVGAVVLRVREPALPRPYRPFVVVPLVFALVSGFVVARGAAFAPAQASVLLVLWVLGALFYVARRLWEGSAS